MEFAMNLKELDDDELRAAFDSTLRQLEEIAAEAKARGISIDDKKGRPWGGSGKSPRE
jgi:hypothetical protein